MVGHRVLGNLFPYCVEVYIGSCNLYSVACAVLYFAACCFGPALELIVLAGVKACCALGKHCVGLAASVAAACKIGIGQSCVCRVIAVVGHRVLGNRLPYCRKLQVAGYQHVGVWRVNGGVVIALSLDCPALKGISCCICLGYCSIRGSKRNCCCVASVIGAVYGNRAVKCGAQASPIIGYVIGGAVIADIEKHPVRRFSAGVSAFLLGYADCVSAFGSVLSDRGYCNISCRVCLAAVLIAADYFVLYKVIARLKGKLHAVCNG